TSASESISCERFVGEEAMKQCVHSMLQIVPATWNQSVSSARIGTCGVRVIATLTSLSQTVECRAHAPERDERDRETEECARPFAGTGNRRDGAAYDGAASVRRHAVRPGCARRTPAV